MTEKTEKTAIVIQVDRGLWKEFRKRAIDENITTVDLVEKAIMKYLRQPANKGEK